ncbi:MAG: amidohydrolase family protein [Gemmatimonadales bacterium]|nr:amidohydrolase family protein [Gemmatimonadales bacterium]
MRWYRIAAVVAVAGGQGQAPPGPGKVALVGVGVVDVAAGRTLPGRTVFIEHGVITRIAPADSVTVDPSYTRVDGKGAFLMPGLADLHAHVRRSEELDLYLAAGVTTIQWLNAGQDDLALRDAIRAGTRRGPAITLCRGGINDVTDSAAAVKEVAQTIAEGFDCLKIYNRFTEPAYRVIIATAAARGVRALGHIPRQLTWQQMLQARPRAVAHAEEFLYSPIESAADVDTIVAGMVRGKIALIATLTNYDMISRQLVELPELLRGSEITTYSPVHRRTWGPKRNRYSTRWTSEQAIAFRRQLTFQRALVRRLDSAGAQILLGTDTGNNFLLPGRSVHDELVQLVLAGLTPASALRTATLNAAAFLGEPGKWGQVVEGARADLLLVAGDPLRDITNTKLILGMMTAGQWHPRTELDDWVEKVRAGYAVEERMVAILERQGPAAAIRFVEAERRRLGRPPLGVIGFNEVAYQYWVLDNDTTKARLFFEANARLYPNDPIAKSSLAEFRGAMRGK